MERALLAVRLNFICEVWRTSGSTALSTGAALVPRKRYCTQLMVQSEVAPNEKF